MTKRSISNTLAIALGAAAMATTAHGAKLIEVKTVDETHISIYWRDGWVNYKDDGIGPGAFMGHESAGGDEIIRYDPPLSTEEAKKTANFTITSSGDPNYKAGLHPSASFRRSKVNGTDNTWPEANYTIEHVVYLRLPQKLQQGKSYKLSIAPAVCSDTSTAEFTFDADSSVSEALHVNLIGYHPEATGAMSADLYMWLGDGGARDYSAFEGKDVFLYNVATKQRLRAGKVAFWKKSARDVGGWNFTQSDVWNCDVVVKPKPGKYRLVVDGIGCSPDFEIKRDVYFEPYKTSVRGFFYMRIGADKNMVPVPRQPRFIPEVDPPGFKVYRTTFGPWHDDWKKMRGDVWDVQDWSKYMEPGSPTNPNAWGGHSDACDWDRHAGHVSIIYDLLLPYLLSNGKLGEDNLGIPESGNGVPDLIDEALYEVDFWLRLRDGKGGYAFGLNNPSRNHTVMYQAGARPFMAWVNAANCAMAAECLRIAGNTKLSNRYRDEAVKAYRFANGEDLDYSYGIGNGQMRGRDYKMMAAAFLYNLTGDRKYEDDMAAECAVRDGQTLLDQPDKYCQYWGAAAYLMCAKNKLRPIHYPDLLANLKASVLHEARTKHLEPASARPSRRCSDDAYGWFQTTQALNALIISHAICDDPAEKKKMAEAMALEADWGLGRNPMNMVQMTGLGSRHADDIYTSGRNDGTPGVHPGHTPYMNANAWGPGFMADPQWYASKGYPSWDKWPHGEALWRARYCYSNNEFTPQQSMRGKMALLGYLFAIR